MGNSNSVTIYIDLYHIHFTSFSSCNGYKLNLHLTCFRRGFIAQSVESHIGIAEVMGLNPVGDSEFWVFFICNCENLFHFYIVVVVSIGLVVTVTHL